VVYWIPWLDYYDNGNWWNYDQAGEIKLKLNWKSPRRNAGAFTLIVVTAPNK
jgi:hypothetical protein